MNIKRLLSRLAAQVHIFLLTICHGMGQRDKQNINCHTIQYVLRPFREEIIPEASVDFKGICAESRLNGRPKQVTSDRTALPAFLTNEFDVYLLASVQQISHQCQPSRVFRLSPRSLCVTNSAAWNMARFDMEIECAIIVQNYRLTFRMQFSFFTASNRRLSY